MSVLPVPADWQSTTLDAVLDVLPSGSKVQQGWSPQCDKKPAGADEWGVLKTTAIQAGVFLDQHNKRLPPHFEPRPALEVMSGDLLLTNAGPRARCAVPCLVRSTRPRLMLSGKFYRFRALKSVMDARFLEYYLLSPSTQRLLDLMKTGISDSGLNLTRAKFLGLPVVVPPLEDQRRIVGMLDDHLSRLDAAAKNLELADRKVKSWAAASADLIFQEVVERVAVGSLLREPMRNGHSASASASGDVRTLTLTAVTKRQFTDFNTKMTSADRHRVQDLWLTSGDVLVERSNTAELVGTTALYTGPDDWAIFPDLLIRLRPDESKILAPFLAAGLASERVHRELRGKAKGLAGSMPKIDQGAISAQLVPCPDLETQRRLLVRHDRLREGVARLQADVDRLRSSNAALRQGLLNAAFTGRLAGRENAAEATGVRT